MMLLLVGFVALGTASSLLVEAEKARRQRAEAERRNRQWRNP